MLASYVNATELLTLAGAWIAARLPHVQSASPAWSAVPDSRVFRVYGLRPFYRCCIIDYTRARFYVGKPAWVRLRVFGLTLYEANKNLSGHFRRRADNS